MSNMENKSEEQRGEGVLFLKSWYITKTLHYLKYTVYEKHVSEKMLSHFLPVPPIKKKIKNTQRDSNWKDTILSEA